MYSMVSIPSLSLMDIDSMLASLMKMYGLKIQCIVWNIR